jgi:Trp operon repressor
MLSDDMQQFVTVAIYQPSQELLELESALVTLSEISTNQADRVKEQQRLLDQQQNQIELLLKIEASIMDNTRGDNQ